MRRLLAATALLSIGLLLLVVAPAQPQLAQHSKRTQSHTVRVKRLDRIVLSTHKWRSTGYSSGSCDNQSPFNARGGRLTIGQVANNQYPLGTRLYLKGRRLMGRHWFTITDRIGWGSELDVFMPCELMTNWNNPTLTWQVVVRRWRWHTVRRTA